MKNRTAKAVTTTAALLLLAGVATPANAAPLSGETVTTHSEFTTHPTGAGGGEMRLEFRDPPPRGVESTQATWGSSYATSKEVAQFIYVGRAKAGANIYQGERIISVCIRYSHPGRSSGTVCSNASSGSGRWVAGDEEVLRFVDNLSLNWPQTKFHVSLGKIPTNML